MLHLLSFLLLLIPFAHAEQSTVWDMRGQLQEKAQIQSLTTVEQTAQGLHVRTATDGYLVWDTPLVHPVEVVTLQVFNLNGKSDDAALLWHPHSAPDGKSLALYFTIPPSNSLQSVHVTPSADPHWDWTSDSIGIAFPAGTDIIIQQIAWQHWSLGDRLSVAWQSFWKMDSFRPYSINFLWGPLLAFDPVTLGELFDHLPPRAWSVLRVVYPLFSLPLLYGAVYVMMHNNRRKAVRTSFVALMACIAMVWIAFDLRMGMEQITYAVHDINSYALDPHNIGQTFRTHENFYALAARALPTLKKEQRYVLVQSSPSPFYSNLRYMTYPSLPIVQGEKDTTGIPLWFVLKRADVSVDDRGRLMRGNTVLVASGALVEKFTEDSLLYRAKQ